MSSLATDSICGVFLLASHQLWPMLNAGILMQILGSASLCLSVCRTSCFPSIQLSTICTTGSSPSSGEISLLSFQMLLQKLPCSCCRCWTLMRHGPAGTRAQHWGLVPLHLLSLSISVVATYLSLSISISLSLYFCIFISVCAEQINIFVSLLCWKFSTKFEAKVCRDAWYQKYNLILGSRIIGSFLLLDFFILLFIPFFFSVFCCCCCCHYL